MMVCGPGQSLAKKILMRKSAAPASFVPNTVYVGSQGTRATATDAVPIKTKPMAAVMMLEVILVFMSVAFLARAIPTLTYADVVAKMRCDEKGLTKELRASLSPLQTG